MSKPIGFIVWPAGVADAVQLYRRYVLQVVEMLGIKFDSAPEDPLPIVQGLLAGSVSEAERDAAMTKWWRYLDNNGLLRNLQDNNALQARLALCLLVPVQPRPEDFGEQLSWFLEVLGLLGADVSVASHLMDSYFNFR